jgi:hypothetical protein
MPGKRFDASAMLRTGQERTGHGDQGDEGDRVASVVPVASVTAKPKRRREVVKIDADVAQRARNAVLFLRGNGQPYATLADLLDQLVSEGLDRLAAELNGGEDFPEGGALPRGGDFARRQP